MPTIQEALERVWNDESLKNNLLSNPKLVLAEFGLEFPKSVEVQVHENTPSLVNYVIPQPSEIPTGVDLEAQDPVAGKLIKTAFANQAFKAKLLKEPKLAIAEATGTELPNSLMVRIYEDTPTLKHLVLPVNPASEELSDAELEAIAGGISKGAQVGIGCGAAGAVAGTLAFTAVGAGITGGIAAGASATGGGVASGKGKC